MRSRRTALILAILALAVVGAGLGARPLVPRIRDAMFRSLARVAVGVTEARAGTMAVPTEVDSAAPAVAQDPAEPLAAPGIAAGTPALQPRAPQAQAAGAIDIPEDRVAHLTEKQLRSLRPANVIGADGAAAGVRLHGIGALGVGLTDADVVTSIDGRPTTDLSTGMDAALRAWASGESVAHATVRRAGRTLAVTVHVPKHARVVPGLGRSAHLRTGD